MTVNLDKTINECCVISPSDWQQRAWDELAQAHTRANLQVLVDLDGCRALPTDALAILEQWAGDLRNARGHLMLKVTDAVLWKQLITLGFMDVCTCISQFPETIGVFDLEAAEAMASQSAVNADGNSDAIQASEGGDTTDATQASVVTEGMTHAGE